MHTDGQISLRLANKCIIYGRSLLEGTFVNLLFMKFSLSWKIGW